MTPIELFIAEYFRARIQDEREYQETRKPFRSRYFTETCKFGSHSETLRMLESERILKIEEDSEVAAVITEQQFDFRGTVKKMQHKYSLVRQGGDWRINEVARINFDGYDLVSHHTAQSGP
jgi:hypothetical protein